MTRRVRDVSRSSRCLARADQTAVKTAEKPLGASVEPTPTADATIPESATPLLDRIGRDLTKMAVEGLLAPVIGREDETAWMIETLLRSTKRNPVLLGQPGVGKTAIVEGLAQRIVAGKVPEALRDDADRRSPACRDRRRHAVPRPARGARAAARSREASQPGIVLFLDEIHVLGVGRRDSGRHWRRRGAQASTWHAATSRSSVRHSGDEYRTTIARDDSLARRFSTLDISELDAQRDAADSGERSAIASRHLVASPSRTTALDVLLEFADRSIVNRRFPDKAIDLVEQAIARARRGRSERR